MGQRTGSLQGPSQHIGPTLASAGESTTLRSVRWSWTLTPPLGLASLMVHFLVINHEYSDVGGAQDRKGCILPSLPSESLTENPKESQGEHVCPGGREHGFTL